VSRNFVHDYGFEISADVILRPTMYTEKTSIFLDSARSSEHAAALAESLKTAASV
jgi:hypothetical protein